MRRKMRFIFPDIDKELYGKKLNSKLLFDYIWKNESGYAILNVRLNA